MTNVDYRTRISKKVPGLKIRANSYWLRRMVKGEHIQRTIGRVNEMSLEEAEEECLRIIKDMISKNRVKDNYDRYGTEGSVVLPKYNPFYYKPLPVDITIRESEIEGLGVFATMDISTEFDLGATHINVPMFDGLIRTPIGGYLNHSDESNCELRKVHDWDDCQIYNLFTIRDIEEGEELRLDYYK